MATPTEFVSPAFAVALAQLAANPAPERVRVQGAESFYDAKIGLMRNRSIAIPVGFAERPRGYWVSKYPVYNFGRVPGTGCEQCCKTGIVGVPVGEEHESWIVHEMSCPNCKRDD